METNTVFEMKPIRHTLTDMDSTGLAGCKICQEVVKLFKIFNMNQSQCSFTNKLVLFQGENYFTEERIKNAQELIAQMYEVLSTKAGKYIKKKTCESRTH